MNYFERLFLSTSVLFGIVILFLLGLYFDMGDLFSSSIGKGGFVTRGAAVDRLIDRLDRTRRVAKKKRSEGACSFGHISRAGATFSMSKGDISNRYRKYFSGSKKIGNDRVDQYRQYLKEQGFKNKKFIEMKSLAQDKTVMNKYLPISRKLSAAGEFEEAICTLEEALAELPQGDYEQRIKLVSKIVELCLRGGFIDKAHQFTAIHIDLESKILTIESTSKLMETKVYSSKVNADLKTVARKRKEVDSAFAAMKKRKKGTGKYDGLFTEEKIAIKAEALGLKSKGEISDEMYKKMLSTLE